MAGKNHISENGICFYLTINKVLQERNIIYKIAELQYIHLKHFCLVQMSWLPLKLLWF